MKSVPNVQTTSKSSSLSLAEDKNQSRQYQNTTSHETEKTPYIQVKAQEKLNVKEFNQNEFAFEKERIKALQHTELYAALSTMNHVSVPIRNLFNPLEKEGSDSNTKKCAALPQIQKVVSVLLILYSIGDIVVTFFAIVFASIHSMPVVSYLTWIVAEFVLIAVFVFASIKGYNAGNFDISAANFHLWRVAIVIILQLGALMGAHISQGIKQMIICSMDWNKEGNDYESNAESMSCIIVVSFFFSCSIRLIMSGIYLALGILIRMFMIDKRTDTLSNDSISAKRFQA